MAGVGFEIAVDDRELQNLFNRLLKRMSNSKHAFQEIGEIVLESVQRNFEEKRAPDGTPWAELAPATEKRKKHPDQILIESQTLFKSIHIDANSDQVSVGTNLIYGAIQQLGGMAGRGHSVEIPARDYLGVRDDDWPEIREALEDWIIHGS